MRLKTSKAKLNWLFHIQLSPAQRTNQLIFLKAASHLGCGCEKIQCRPAGTTIKFDNIRRSVDFKIDGGQMRLCQAINHSDKISAFKIMNFQPKIGGLHFYNSRLTFLNVEILLLLHCMADKGIVSQNCTCEYSQACIFYSVCPTSIINK